MANQVACFLRPGRHHEIQGHGTPDALKMKTCRVFSRYLNLALGVLSKQINQSKDYSSLVERGVLTPKESELLVPAPSGVMFVYRWLLDLTEQCYHVGWLSDLQAQMLRFNVQKMRGAASDVLQYVNTMLPHQYVLILSQIVHLTLGLHALVVGFEVADLLLVQHPGMPSPSFAEGPDVWLAAAVEFVYLALECLIYRGILSLYTALQNPFERDMCDFSTETMELAVLASTSHAISNRDLPFDEQLGELFAMPSIVRQNEGVATLVSEDTEHVPLASPASVKAEEELGVDGDMPRAHHE